ncbi:SWIM zinc finger family protein [Halorussus halophilus]|uniref:SWIM zinc finger family protein n=1 Tax=Halorussus halophilus TaxID=2650975 RepID=UPI001300F27E|nr:SWIM zinc finger family protein [Halorussus halophilus]
MSIRKQSGDSSSDPTEHVLSVLEFTTRTAKRAQYEAFEFTVTTDGVEVRNTSHANPSAHEYLVTVHNGIPKQCGCPADAKYEGACKHRLAVAIRTPILEAATHRLATDGGVQTASPQDDSERPDDCNCVAGSDFPCWECYRSGRRDLPEV